jgi:hypothetical protein
MTEHPEITDYRAERARVYADFIAQADADLAAFRANPEDFDMSDAINLVGVDEVISMFLAGRLTQKPAA